VNIPCIIALLRWNLITRRLSERCWVYEQIV
jgi:hypothetical protein